MLNRAITCFTSSRNMFVFYIDRYNKSMPEVVLKLILIFAVTTLASSIGLSFWQSFKRLRRDRAFSTIQKRMNNQSTSMKEFSELLVRYRLMNQTQSFECQMNLLANQHLWFQNEIKKIKKKLGV